MFDRVEAMSVTINMRQGIRRSAPARPPPLATGASGGIADAAARIKGRRVAQLIDVQMHLVTDIFHDQQSGRIQFSVRTKDKTGPPLDRGRLRVQRDEQFIPERLGDHRRRGHQQEIIRQQQMHAGVTCIGPYQPGRWFQTLLAERLRDHRGIQRPGPRNHPAIVLHVAEIDLSTPRQGMLRSRDDNAEVRLVDAAYWMKGCSSLGRLRYAVLLEVVGRKTHHPDYCLMDLKEAVVAAAPRAKRARMPADQATRVVEGARHLSPFLGQRMRAVSLMGKSVFVRELLPQDLKIEIEQISREEAINVARYLAAVVGKAHSRQLDAAARNQWLKDLRRNRSKPLDAPGWLWSSVVELLAGHERAYLEHCRTYALEA